MLNLYNSMTRTLEAFEPRDESGRVKIFTCGPSIYRRPHIGNYRTFLYEDLLVRYLEYLGYKVKRVINFTDVEDKTIIEADNQGRSMEEVTTDVADHFFHEAELLCMKLPAKIPRSSTSVLKASEIIAKLMKSGHAYAHNGDIFFDPLKYKDFGKLYRLDMSRWPDKKVRFRRDTYVGNRWNRGDFILWHGYRDGDSAFWDTPVGKGRPSWNIQDPAMIVQHLGLTVDINCGGIDNIYRHHDYNIAIMESLSGEDYAKYYLHGEHLVVDGKPMSKSRGNMLYPDDILGRGYAPHHLRFFLIYQPYRARLNYTHDRFRVQAERVDALRHTVNELLEGGPGSRKIARSAVDGDERRDTEVGQAVARLPVVFEENMNANLGVGAAFDGLAGILGRLLRFRTQGRLNEADRRATTDALLGIDIVLKVIFTD